MPPRIDDKTIGDEALLLRRILDIPMWTTKLEDGQLKLSSVAFLDNHTNEVSVNVAEQTNPDTILESYPDLGLVSIKAGIPRSQNHIVAKTPEEPDPSHRVICPPTEYGGKKRKAAAREMAKNINWIIFPKSYRN